MKGILGRKLGMTQLFSEHGRSIPVSVIQVQENVITQIFQKEKDGYNAVQLSTGNKRDKLVTKPLKGHFAKSNTKGKYFVKEIRNMIGYKLGDKLNASLFSVGELVDITGTSKGKGFQGNIKRHNQHIGPKSHGGGGGSQPVRQTGSIGDVVSNKVNKGMTMPGQMGNEKVTIQNLEIIFVDLENNSILVKGSIPGPKKSWLVIKESIKGLPKKDPQKLVDLKEIQLKNELLEKAKKVGAKVNTDMTIDEMEKIINVSLEDKENKEKNNG